MEYNKEEVEKFNNKKSSITKNVTIAIIIALISGMFIFIGSFFVIIGFGGILIALIIFAVQINKFKKLNIEFKENIIRDIMSKIIDRGEFLPKSGLSQTAVYEGDALVVADRFNSSDYLSGYIDDVSFESSDVSLQRRETYTDSNGHSRTRYVTYFQGRVFNFEFNKDVFKGVYVFERGKPRGIGKTQKIQLESIDFNKKFKTYCKNEHDAFYVLTPHLMEAMMRFEEAYYGDIYFSFKGDKMHIAINTNRNAFELSFWTKVTEETIKQYYKDFEIIKDVVNELKLNRKLFKKEA